MMNSPFSFDGRSPPTYPAGRLFAAPLHEMFDVCYQPGFDPNSLATPLNKLLALFEPGSPSQREVQEAAQAFIARSSLQGNPKNAAEGVIKFLDGCFVEGFSPTTLRPHLQGILSTFKDPELVQRVMTSVSAVAARAERYDVDLCKTIGANVEDNFVRSERMAQLMAKVRREVESGEKKTDGPGSTHGVTWYEPSSGREIERMYVLDKGTGPNIARLVEQLQRRFVYMNLGVRAPVRIMMDGPPGTGKTCAARLIAYRLRKPCAVMRLDEIVGRLIGDTAKNVKAVLDAAASRRAVLFLDEVDGLFPPRDGDLTGSGGEELRRITSAFLQQMNMLPKKQIIICATNRPDALDAAFLRRFPDRISFGFPDADTRQEIVRRTWKKMPNGPEALQALVHQTGDTSGDFVTIVAMAAARIAIDRLFTDDPAVIADAMAEAGLKFDAEAEKARADAELEEAQAASARAMADPAIDPVKAAEFDEDVARAAERVAEAKAKDRERAHKKGREKAAARARLGKIRDRVQITLKDVEMAIKSTPRPPPTMGRDRAGRPAQPQSTNRIIVV